MSTLSHFNMTGENSLFALVTKLVAACPNNCTLSSGINSNFFYIDKKGISVGESILQRKKKSIVQVLVYQEKANYL